jgi:hypothetical protein
MDRGPETCSRVVRAAPFVIQYAQRTALEQQLQPKNLVVTMNGPNAWVAADANLSPYGTAGAIRLAKQTDGRWLISQLGTFRADPPPNRRRPVYTSGWLAGAAHTSL